MAEKARFAAEAVWAGIPGGRAGFAETAEDLSGDLTGGGMAYLRLAVRGDDEQAVGRAFSGAVVETSLSSYPGTFFTSAPSGAQGVARYWPTTVAAAAVHAAHRVRRPTGAGHAARAVDGRARRRRGDPRPATAAARPAPLGAQRRRATWCGSRSGSSSAPARGTRAATPTSGVWADDDAVAAWLQREFSVERSSRPCCPRSSPIRSADTRCRTCGR